MSMPTDIFVRRYAYHHALLIVFLASALRCTVLALWSHQSPKPITVIDGVLLVITDSRNKTWYGQAIRNRLPAG